MTSLLDDAFAHHIWATERLIDACATLTREQLLTPVPGTYGPIMATLTHLVASDGWYLSFFREQPAPIDEESSVTLVDLRAAIAANGAVWRDILAGDPEPDADLVERGDGWEFHQPAGLRLAQAIHHGTDHRSQVCTALTSHGHRASRDRPVGLRRGDGPHEGDRGVTIRVFYDRWPQYERRLAESIRDLTPEQLALRAAPEHWRARSTRGRRSSSVS